MADVPDQTGRKDEQPALQERIDALLSGSSWEERQLRRVQVLVNPAAGRGKPDLDALNAVFQASGARWEVRVTRQEGDTYRMTKEAVEASADVVAVFGGDGTVREAANGLVGAGIPLAILPGGTGNVMAAELGIPSDLLQACALAADPHPHVRSIDLGQIDDQHFVLRASTGLEQAMVEGANPELKERLGAFAYALAGVQALAEPPLAVYQLAFDDQEVEVEGVTCIIANSGTLGRSGALLAPDIAVDDGWLDLIVLRSANLASLISLAAALVTGGEEDPEQLLHWQVKEVVVKSDPPQRIQADGELLGETPVTVKIIPQAVSVITPHPEGKAP